MQVDEVTREKDLKAMEEGANIYPPGHYYSPFPNLIDIRAKEEEIFDNIPGSLPGIELNEEEQLSLYEKFKEYYAEQPFGNESKEGLRYYFNNNFYCHSDAIFLYSMIRHLKPKRIIEIGSGFSSAVTLDTNELFFNNSINCIFIDPEMDRLRSLIKESDKESVTIHRKKLQDVDFNIFGELEAGDILFVDSSHICKTYSDVNMILFNILPALKKGVFIHFHDIFYPFEYPKQWVYRGTVMTEAYLLRAFLQFNNAFKIRLFNTFLEYFHENKFRKEMPICMENTGGSIWLEKVR